MDTTSHFHAVLLVFCIRVQREEAEKHVLYAIVVGVVVRMVNRIKLLNKKFFQSNTLS